MPEVVDVVDGHLLAWSEASDKDGITFRGGDDLLPAFLQLSTAEPEEMAAFIETYGAPEICQHGQPDRHPDSRRKGTFCSPLRAEDGRPAIASADIRKTALALIAAQDAAVELARRSLPPPKVWEAMTWLQIPVGRNLKDWRDGREDLARWLTELMTDCGTSVVADWEGPRMKLTSRADGLLSTLVLLHARELGQAEVYTCDVCGAPVERVRPPRPSSPGRRREGVYCKKPACRREQQRLNQAAWRAGNPEEKSDG